MKFSQAKILGLNRWIYRISLGVLVFSLLTLTNPLLTASSQTITGLNTAREDLSLNVKAFLDTIAWAEGTYNEKGYRTIFTGVYFSKFKDHPQQRRCITYKGKQLCSDAAGRYQFLLTTWVGLRKKLKLSDFSPRSQDLAAVQLIREKGVLKSIESGSWESAIYKVAGIWASLPKSPNGGSVYGQPYKPIELLRPVYEKNLIKYRQPDFAPIIQPPPCETALFGDCTVLNSQKSEFKR